MATRCRRRAFREFQEMDMSTGCSRGVSEVATDTVEKKLHFRSDLVLVLYWCEKGINHIFLIAYAIIFVFALYCRQFILFLYGVTLI